jgi:hypothetical protein
VAVVGELGDVPYCRAMSFRDCARHVTQVVWRKGDVATLLKIFLVVSGNKGGIRSWLSEHDLPRCIAGRESLDHKLLAEQPYELLSTSAASRYIQMRACCIELVELVNH